MGTGRPHWAARWLRKKRLVLAFAAIGMITVTTFVFGPLVSVGWRFHALVDETPDRDLVDSLLREPSFESIHDNDLRHYEVQMVAHIKSGSTWLSLLLGHFFTRLYAPRSNARQFSQSQNGQDMFAPASCDVTERDMSQDLSVQREHCCVYFFKVPGCSRVRQAASGDIDAVPPPEVTVPPTLPPSVRRRFPNVEVEHTGSSQNTAVAAAAPFTGALAGGFPVFSSDKHLQYVRNCVYRATKGKVDCDFHVDHAVSRFRTADVDAGRDEFSRRYVVLIRDPRDIAISWMYYRCFKTFNQVFQRLQRLKKTTRYAEAMDDFNKTYSHCIPLRENPSAMIRATVTAAQEVSWNATRTLVSEQTIESVIGQSTQFYCDFLRSTGQAKDQVHVVYYEDLRSDVVGEMESLLAFLGFPRPTEESTEAFRASFPEAAGGQYTRAFSSLGGVAALYDDDAFSAMLQDAVNASSFGAVHAVESALAPASDAASAATIDASLLDKYKNTRYKPASFAPPSTEPENFHTRDGSTDQWRLRYSVALKRVSFDLIQARANSDCPEMLRYLQTP